MRGIQINNYFNNHITLNGKKLNQDPHPLIQTTKPKPIEFVHQPDSNVLQNRSPPSKSAQLPPKKRTNTLVQLKKHVPAKRSVSNDRQRNANSAKKKQQNASDQSEKQEEQLINISNRKLKPSNSKGGLGKRSKSTIIKTNHQETQRDHVKKEPKKVNSNPTVESVKPKTKRKKSSKIIEPLKETKSTLKPTTMKKVFIPVFSKELPKKEKLNLKLDKTDGKGEKKSARNNNNIAKSSVTNKGKTSKPVSARQKKSKKSRFIEQLKQKYENQTILEQDFINRQKESQQKVDTQFLSVMNSLQKVLNSVGSKKILKKQLQLINQKLKQFKLQSQKAESQENDNRHQQRLHQDCTPLLNPLQQVEVQYNRDSQEEEELSHQESKHQQYSDQQEEYQPKEDINHERQYLEERELVQQQQRNPLTGKRKNDFFFDETQQKNSDGVSDRKKQIELLKQFKKQSTKMMEKVGLNQPASLAELPKQHPGLTTLQKEQGKLQKDLMVVNISGLTNSGNFEDKYPLAGSKSPKFDENHLLNMITLKQQFASNKHNKMSELVKKMFQKQLVSPRSYQFQLRNLDKKYEQENKMVQSLKKQAEQMSSMLSEIKKDKEQIKNIDDLIRNQQWEEAQKLVHINKAKELDQKNKKAELKWDFQHQNTELKQIQEQKKDNTAKDRFSLGWDREQGWQRVKVKKADVQDNEFVDYGGMINRNRTKAQAKIDIDEQCGGTQESIELQQAENKASSEQEYIYYNQQNDHIDERIEQGGLIRLVQISTEQKSQNLQERTKKDSVFNNEVIHIQNQQAKQRSLEASIIDKNPSNVSVTSSQSDRKGFTTNLYFIKEYCIALCQFVRDNEIFKAQFKNNILKPLEFQLIDLMKYLESTELADFYFKKRESKNAISEVIWNEFNAQYESLKCNMNKGKTGQRYVLQKEQELIFVRMIYEVLNESLDFQRPGGQHGKALPWKQNAKHLKNLKQLTQNEKDNLQPYDLMFGVAIARIIQWGSCLCGFLPDTVELENTEIDESYVNHIRETRMAFLLQKMMAEDEPMMSNFEMQETAIYYRLASLIVEDLLLQTTGEIETISNTRSY